jgi:hypothetical protein
MTILLAIAAFIALALTWALTAPTSFWYYASRFGVPFLVTSAWIFLAISAETDATGYSWMAVGFAIVLVLWFLFRVAIARAGLARAVAVGDHERLRQLAAKGQRTSRAMLYRALADDMQGKWEAVLDALAGVRGLDGTRKFLAESTRIGAQVERRDAAAARKALAQLEKIENVGGGLPTPAPLLRALAEGRVLWIEGKLDDAEPKLQRVIDDIRTGPYTRGVAHVYAARIAEAKGDAAAAVRERAAAHKLAPNTWVATA